MLACAARPDQAIAGADADDLGFTLLWSTVKPQLDALLALVNVLNADISGWYRSAPKTAANDTFANGWSAWRDTFYGYYKYASNRWASLFPPAPWAVADAVEKHTLELSGWRAQYEQRSGQKATGPDPKVYVPGAEGTSIWVWLAVAAGAATAAIFAAKAIVKRSPTGFIARKLVFSGAMSRKELEAAAWAAKHADYKARGADRVRRMLYLNPKTGATELWPLKQIPVHELRRVAGL